MRCLVQLMPYDYALEPIDACNMPIDAAISVIKALKRE